MLELWTSFQRSLDDLIMTSTNNDSVLEAFGTLENARKTAALVQHFTESFDQNQGKQPLDAWLIQEFKAFPDAWQSETELHQAVTEIISTVQTVNAKHTALVQHLSAGKSQEMWLAQELETSARAAEATDMTAYVAKADDAMSVANQQLYQRVPSELAAQLPAAGEVQTYQSAQAKHGWNPITRLDLTRKLSQKFLTNAALTGLANWKRQTSLQAWQLLGVPAQQSSPNVTAYFNQPLSDAPNALTEGMHIMYGGVTYLATKQGLIPCLQNQSPCQVTHMTSLGLETTKAASQVGLGKVSALDALGHIAKRKLAHLATITSEAVKVGSPALGSMIGGLFSSHAATVGASIGSWVGEKAAPVIRTAIETGGEKLINTCVSVAKSAIQTTKTVATKTWNFIKSIFS